MEAGTPGGWAAPSRSQTHPGPPPGWGIYHVSSPRTSPGPERKKSVIGADPGPGRKKPVIGADPGPGRNKICYRGGSWSWNKETC